jgi:hypothetical protein
MAFGQLPDRLGGFAQRIHAFSMTGVTSPASMSSLRTSRSFAFSVETSALSFWLTNGELSTRDVTPNGRSHAG